MATAIFDTHAFVKRLTAAGMPVEQAEILADQSTRAHRRAGGDQAGYRAPAGGPWLLRADMTAMEQRIKDQLTIRLGLMMAGAIAIIAALVKLL